MRHDLVFHITDNEHWEKYKSGGQYQPESLEEEGFIHCSTGEQIEKIANRDFEGETELLLLVIDTALVNESIKYEKSGEGKKKYPHIYAPLDTVAVIDKIKLFPNSDGTFEIAFNTYT